MERPNGVFIGERTLNLDAQEQELNRHEAARRTATTDHLVDPQHHRLIAPARGSFRSPSRRSGTWTGAYRLDGFSSEYGQLTATGVFTGYLADAGPAQCHRPAGTRVP